MDARTVERQIKYMLIEVMHVEPQRVTDDARLIDDLSGDPLEITRFWMKVEETYGIETYDDDVERIATVGEAVRYVQSLVG
jgi:acyl carrier protein